MPKITIVTPSFNQGRFLESTMRSVLDQGYPHLEYMVMDGGSTDGSVDVIRRYADRLAYWQSSPDGGQAAAILQGFQRATGDILAWVNSDDLLLPGCLQAVGEFFLRHPLEQCVVGGCLIIDACGKPVLNRLGMPRVNPGHRLTFRQLLVGGYGFHQPATFWRRQAFFEVGGLDTALRFCMDMDLYLRLARRRPLARMSDILACFRQHQASKTSTLRDVQRVENELSWRRYGKYDIPMLLRVLLKSLYSIDNQLRNRLFLMKLWLGLAKMPRPAPDRDVS